MNAQTADNSLNDLLEYLYDSHYGYLECAKEVSDPSLKNLFEDLAQKRLVMLYDIKKAMSLPDIDTTKHGSITGALHRTFIDLKSMVTNGDKDAIIAEIKRGESFTLSKYESIIQEEPPQLIKDLLIKQLNEVQNNLVMIDTLASIPR